MVRVLDNQICWFTVVDNNYSPYFTEEAQKDQTLPSDVTEDTIRADEFEELAKICLDKKQ